MVTENELYSFDMPAEAIIISAEFIQLFDVNTIATVANVIYEPNTVTNLVAGTEVTFEVTVNEGNKLI